MPYISKADRERARWLCLPEVVALVQAADGCSAEQAQTQIREALRDGAIWPLCWSPEPASPSYRGSGVRIPGYPPPSRGGEDWRVLDHWRVVKLDWESSRVLDTFARAEHKALRELYRQADTGPTEPPPPRKSVWRRLLLSRFECERLWPHQVAESEYRPATAAPEPAADQIEKPDKRHVKRGQVDKLANEILEEQKADLVKTNGLLFAAQVIADQMEPSPRQRTVYKYIRDRYWELAKEMGVPKSPTSSKGKG